MLFAQVKIAKIPPSSLFQVSLKRKLLAQATELILKRQTSRSGEKATKTLLFQFNFTHCENFVTQARAPVAQARISRSDENLLLKRECSRVLVP